jgi:hypothetical protein
VRQERTRWGTGAQGALELGQDSVTGLLPMGIVEGLELVEVDEGDSYREVGVEEVDLGDELVKRQGVGVECHTSKV